MTRKINILKPTFIRNDLRGNLTEILNEGNWANISYGKMKKGAVIGNHFHKKTLVFFFLTSGLAKINLIDVKSIQKRLLTISPNQGLLLPPNQIHPITFLKQSTFIMARSQKYISLDNDSFPPKQDNQNQWEQTYLKNRRILYFRKRRLASFQIPNEAKLLDLGCGDGLDIFLLQKMGLNNLIGVDPSTKLIKIAKKRNPNVNFSVASAEKLPFANNQFNVILVDSVFHHLPSFDITLKEIYRVLKHEGQLCFIEPHSSPPRQLIDYFSTFKLARKIPLFGNRARGYILEKETMDHWLSNENLFLTALKKVGFKKRLIKRDLLSVIGVYKK